MVAATASLAGSLDDFPAPALFRLVARSRRTGTLTIQSGPHDLAICFADGVVTYAGPAELPGVRAALVGAGVVPPPSWERAERDSTGAGARLVDQLTQDRAVTPEVLHDGLYELAVNTVFELLLPSRAPFRFEAAVTHRLAGGGAFDVEAVVADAAARLQAWRMIADVIPTTSLVVRLVPQLPVDEARVVIEREEWPVLAAVDGVRDVAAIVTHTGLSAFGVCGVLHRLITRGIAATDLQP